MISMGVFDEWIGGDLDGQFVASEFGYDATGLARVARNAFVAAGVEPEVKTKMLQAFDKWVSDNR